MKKLIFLLFFTIANFILIPAQLKGLVRGISPDDTTLLNGAKIKLLNARTSQFADAEGKFEMYLGKNLPDTLLVSYPGFITDTIIVTKDDRFGSIYVLLFSDHLKPEVLVEMKRKSGTIKMKTLQVELLNSAEFRKAACCNLSESFESNASIDVNITDAVSGARRIQLLGLDGVYTQFQLENIPFLRGLETAYGMQSLSGIWLNSIQISKGTGSVVNGHESMAGLINLELKQPQNMEKLLLNGYLNRLGRGEGNLILGHVFNEKWSTAFLGNGSYNGIKVDENRDGFLDLPLFNNIAFMNRWHYEGKNMEAQMGVNTYIDSRLSGNIMPSNSSNIYKMNADNKHLDLFAKTGFFGKKPSQSLGVIYHIKYHDLQGAYGDRLFQGNEKRAFLSLVYDDANKSEEHKFKSGISLNYLNIKQNVFSFNRDREELISGVFIEHDFSTPRFSLISGFRIDYHSITGWQWVPRLHGKYSLSPKTDFRFTAGKGWRIPNYLIENLALLANNKSWIVTQNVLPEVSWNVGGSLVTEGEVFSKKITWTTDFYYTWFERQLVVDRDKYQNSIVMSYQENSSYSISIQSELNIQVLKNYEIKLAYKYLDVKSLLNDQVQTQTMISKNRILLTSNLTSLNKRWQWDLTATVLGAMRMPSSYAEMSTTPWYTIINSQVIYKWKKWDVYLGIENALNYKLDNPILLADQPSNSGFDASMVWGPIVGINTYVGFRYEIKNKK